MFCPAPLHIGDTIGLIAPCSPIKPERLVQCVQMIELMGFHVILGKSAKESLHGYLSGDDTTRADDIHEMFCNPKVNAIFCLRGGYGSTRIMNLLDYSVIAKHPKIFVGYSDVTSFHLAFHKLCNFITFHGPMVSSNMVDDFDPYTQYSFFRAVSMPQVYHFKNPSNARMKAIVPGDASGRIIGGCLSLVAPCIGTFYEPIFRNKILFLEDVEESLPRCDKLMQQMKNAGIFEQVSGVVLGNFVDCTNPNDPSYSMLHFFEDFFQDYNRPVLYGVQSGHAKPMGTIPFGTRCAMNTKTSMIKFYY